MSIIDFPGQKPGRRSQDSWLVFKARQIESLVGDGMSEATATQAVDSARPTFLRFNGLLETMGTFRVRVDVPPEHHDAAKAAVDQTITEFVDCMGNAILEASSEAVGDIITAWLPGD